MMEPEGTIVIIMKITDKGMAGAAIGGCDSVRRDDGRWHAGCIIAFSKEPTVIVQCRDFEISNTGRLMAPRIGDAEDNVDIGDSAIMP
jgi:hypothetical protein